MVNVIVEFCKCIVSFVTFYDSETMQVRSCYKYSWDSTGFGWNRTTIVKNAPRFTRISSEISYESVKNIPNPVRIKMYS